MTTISVFLDAHQPLHHILHRFYTYFHSSTAREGPGNRGDCNQHLKVDYYM